MCINMLYFVCTFKEDPFAGDEEEEEEEISSLSGAEVGRLQKSLIQLLRVRPDYGKLVTYLHEGLYARRAILVLIF